VIRSSNRRSRGRNNNRGKGGNNRSQVFDSNGPEVRIRGTAHQICEKYEGLAKDARSSGDMVLAESYLQHAEHYQRMIVQWDAENREREASQAERHNNNQQKDSQPERKVISAGNDDQNNDLGLPGSILGDKVDVAEAPAQEKKTLEKA